MVMVVIMPVVMVMIMVMLVIMVMIVIMVVIMVMLVIMMMVMGVMIVTLPVLLFLEMPVKVLHVVVVTVMFFVEDNVEVTAVYGCFFDPADPDLKSVSGNPFKDTQELLLIGSQVEKSRNRHIAADSRPAFQIKDSISALHLNLHKQGD